MTALLLNGSTVYFEMDLGLLLLLAVLALPTLVLVVTAIAAATYQLGERVAPQEQRHLVGGLEGQCAAKDQTNAQLLNLVARQAEQIGATRGMRKHLKSVGV